MASYTKCDTMAKKTLGLKQYKKMEKAKKCAKRTAAAQEAKVKTTNFPVTAVIGACDIMSTKISSTKQEALDVNPDRKVIFDVIAHRKALEAKLYEKMETPLEMLVRCKYQLSLDAEFDPKGDSSADVVSQVASLDDNGFEMIRRTSSSDNLDELTIEETLLSPQESLDAGKVVACIPGATETLKCGPNSLYQRFVAVAVKEKVAMPSTASYDPHWTDPAIVGYKIKRQTPEKAKTLSTNSSRALKQPVEATKNLDSRSSHAPLSTPDSSPTKTHRSHSSSPSESSMRPWTPPTPPLHPHISGHWAHYGQPKLCDVMDWGRLQWAVGQWR